MTARISRDTYGLRLAEAAASRADCTRRQVGAVIVAEDGSVVATGYNGLASGLPGCASAGACPRGQMAYPSEPPVQPEDYVEPGGDECGEQGSSGYGCTAHRDGWHIATAWSRVIEAWPVADTHPADTGYEATGCRAVHAEVNAIIRAGRDRCVGATIYVTDEPCFHCSVVIEGAGIARVVTPNSHDDHQDAEGWMGRVPATAPPPSVAAGAPTYVTGGYVGHVDGGSIRDTIQAASDRAHALPAYTGVTLGQPTISVTTRATSGPLDPEVHAALVRSVERDRAERAAAEVAHAVREDIRSDFLNDDGLAPWER